MPEKRRDASKAERAAKQIKIRIKSKIKRGRRGFDFGWVVIILRGRK